MASHALYSDLKQRYDVRRLGDLVSDDDTRATDSSMGGSTTTGPGAVIQTALDDATGTINAAVLAGKRYSLLDLLNMDADSRSLLKRICCDIAYGLLVSRRGYGGQEGDTLVVRSNEATEILEQLRNGERVFSTDKHTAAGNLTQAVLSDKIPLFSKELDRYFGLRQSDRNQWH